MRYIFLTCMIFGAAVCVAQNIPAGPSPLVVEDPGPAETNSAPLLTRPVQEVPGEYVPSIGLGKESGEIAVPAEVPTVDVGTNSAGFTQAGFLMDAGVQYEDDGEYAEAEKAYLRALEKIPGNADIRFRLSTLYIRMNRYKDAVGILESMGKEFPDNAMVQNNLAWIYASGGEMKNGALALRHAREALLSAPFAASVWNTLAEAYYVCGKYDEALRASEQAFELLNANKPSEEEKASFQAQYAKIQRAAEAYKRMLNLDSGK